jgi:uncharacterized protein with HEPN domain
VRRSDDRLHLIHIAESVERIRRYTEGGREAFLTDTMIQDAVLRNLQTLAESATRLSCELKAAHPDVDWMAIGGFRNILVHDYLGVNLERVWNVVAKHVPALKAKVDGLLKEPGDR